MKRWWKHSPPRWRKVTLVQRHDPCAKQDMWPQRHTLMQRCQRERRKRTNIPFAGWAVGGEGGEIESRWGQTRVGASVWTQGTQDDGRVSFPAGHLQPIGLCLTGLRGCTLYPQLWGMSKDQRGFLINIKAPDSPHVSLHDLHPSPRFTPTPACSQPDFLRLPCADELSGDCFARLKFCYTANESYRCPCSGPGTTLWVARF